ATNSVITKRVFPLATAGRWILTGFPGPSKIPPGFPNALVPGGLGTSLVGVLEGVTVGGAATETIDVSPVAPFGGDYWTSGEAVGIAHISASAETLTARVYIPGDNEANIVVADF